MQHPCPVVPPQPLLTTVKQSCIISNFNLVTLIPCLQAKESLERSGSANGFNGVDPRMSQVRHLQFKETVNGQKAPIAPLYEHGNKILHKIINHFQSLCLLPPFMNMVIRCLHKIINHFWSMFFFSFMTNEFLQLDCKKFCRCSNQKMPMYEYML